MAIGAVRVAIIKFPRRCLSSALELCFVTRREEGEVGGGEEKWEEEEEGKGGGKRRRGRGAHGQGYLIQESNDDDGHTQTECDGGWEVCDT